MGEREAEAIDRLRALEGSRLDRPQLALWDRAISGDTRAADTVLCIIQERSKLLGLYDHPTDWYPEPRSMFLDDWLKATQGGNTRPRQGDKWVWA